MKYTLLNAFLALGLVASCSEAKTPESLIPSPEPKRIFTDLTPFQGLDANGQVVEVAGTIRVNPVYWNQKPPNLGDFVNKLADQNPDLGLDTQQKRDACAAALLDFNNGAFNVRLELVDSMRFIFIKPGTCGSKEVQ